MPPNGPGPKGEYHYDDAGVAEMSARRGQNERARQKTCFGRNTAQTGQNGPVTRRAETRRESGSSLPVASHFGNAHDKFHTLVEHQDSLFMKYVPALPYPGAGVNRRQAVGRCGVSHRVTRPRSATACPARDGARPERGAGLRSGPGARPAWPAWRRTPHNWGCRYWPGCPVPRDQRRSPPRP